jgi:N-acetyl-1-D-myo-inositol-2-amino-2-deoxy-alpha-D-glucopyranoside deacetylase
VEELGYVDDDALVSAVIHAEDQVEAKAAAMRAHATQILVEGHFFALSNHVGMRVLGTEYYQLADGGAAAGAPVAGDLFAGLGR